MSIVVSLFYTLLANRQHGGEHNILVLWSSNRAFTEEYLVSVDEMNQLGSFSFTFQLAAMKSYENTTYLHVTMLLLFNCLFKNIMIKPLNLSTNLPAWVLLMSLSG